jgi:superfamily II DNA/RNA helicase
VRWAVNRLLALERPAHVMTGATAPSEREIAIGMFQRDGGVLVLTSAATEGFGLSFVKLCAHYDTPWNPSVLAQRLGQVHRLGATPGAVRHPRRGCCQAACSVCCGWRWAQAVSSL